MTSVPAVAEGRPTVHIRGTAYPVLLPTIRDPRLHLAGVIVTLQVLGQTTFDFDLSIAQILVSLATCAVLEVTIAFRRQRVLMWPASALLTGNGVAFVLRVPGTEHGDWWSMNGWWIFAGTAAVALLSKYVIVFRGRHVFNPSNFGLVLCFLLIGPERADPLAFWWGPMSVWLALALVLIVGGGLAILRRLRLVAIAVGFWLTFAAGIAVLAATGHEMTAAWHLGPIGGLDLWWLLVTSPEILVFLFFMITDPRTIPASDGSRRVYAVSVGFLAALLMAPWTTEFAHKVALLGALALVCALRPLLLLVAEGRAERAREWARGTSSAARAGGAAIAATLGVALLVLAALPTRPEAALAAPTGSDRAPTVTVVSSPGLAPVDRRTARRIAADLVTDLEVAAEALRTRNRARASDAATGQWLAELWSSIDASRGEAVDVTTYDADRIRLRLERGEGQGPPLVVATLLGTTRTARYGVSGAQLASEGEPVAVERTFEMVERAHGYLVFAVRGAPTAATVSPVRASFTLTDVAATVGLDFRHGAFRYTLPGEFHDETAMMGGGVCWLDYDNDGWLDLYVVNGYAETDTAGYRAEGALPKSRLYRNVRGRFRDVTAASGAGLGVRGSGCVAADLDGNGATDLLVTTAGYDVARDAYDALLWNDGHGRFTEGAWRAGIRKPGWHTGAAVADVDGDGRLDVFVAGYTDVNAPIPGSESGFPADHLAERDLLYLNVGNTGRYPSFREVGRAAGLEPHRLDHGLGASFVDVDANGRADLYVANDLDPNRLYVNVACAAATPDCPLGFRFVERGGAERVDDPNAGMGVAAADYSGDGLDDLFVTNSRGQLHAAYRSRAVGPFADVRPDFAAALGQRSTGWGATWVDLDLDGSLELALANGAIPVTSLAENAERLEVVSTANGDVRQLRSVPSPAGTDAGSQPPTSTTTATSTSPSARSAGGSSSCGTTARAGTGSRSRSRASRRARA